MVQSSFSGMEQLLNLFDLMPKASDQELKDDLPKIGATVLAAQKEAVPVRTGDLWRGLSVQVVNDGHTVRVGLIGTPATSKSALRKTQRDGRQRFDLGPLFYGRIVEFGRRTQIVSVERRRRVLVNGTMILRTSRRRKIAADIAARYSYELPGTPARPFVYSPAAEAAALDGGVNLANFWDRVLSRVGGLA